MLYLVIALVILVGVIVALGFALRASALRVDALIKEKADAEVGSLQREANLKDQLARHEALEKGLKDELAAMEKDVAACRDPVVVRDRLSRLLADPGSR